jgi:hypothetical protein
MPKLPDLTVVYNGARALLDISLIWFGYIVPRGVFYLFNDY